MVGLLGDRTVFNVAVAARGGRSVGVYRKRLLPTYDVFDEGRHFEAGKRPLVLSIAGARVGVTICEDIWNDQTFWKRPLYPTDPVAALRTQRLDLLVSIYGSPYTLGKERLQVRIMARSRAAVGSRSSYAIRWRQRQAHLRWRFDESRHGARIGRGQSFGRTSGGRDVGATGRR